MKIYNTRNISGLGYNKTDSDCLLHKKQWVKNRYQGESTFS